MRQISSVRSHPSLTAQALLAVCLLLLAALLLVAPGLAEEPIEDYIVQGKTVQAVAEAIDTVGGEATHELKIIRAVAARLTQEQRDQLIKERHITRIWADSEASVSSAGSLTVLERFDTASFSNQDGPDSWTGSWQENDPAGGSGPFAGEVQILNGELRMDEQQNTGGDPWVRRTVNLEGYTSATLSFDYRTSAGVDPSDEVAVEIYYNGGWYHMLEQFGGFQGAVSGSKIYDISPFISATTQVRIRVAVLFGGGNEYFYVDNVQISASTDGGGNGVVNRTVRDQFDAATWNNNDGPDNWTLPWVEVDPESGGDGTAGGQVRITGGELRLDDQPNTGGYPSVARRVDLAGVTDALFSFDFRTSSGVDPSDVISVEVSGNDLDCPMCPPHDWDYTLLESITGIRGAVTGSRTYNISDHISNATHVRIRVTKYYGGSNEYFYVDNLEVRGASGAWSVRDELNFVDYANNDGTRSWSGSWSEIGESDGPWSGNASVSTFSGGEQGLRLSATGRGLERHAGVADATTAVLSFDYLRQQLGTGESVSAQISGDGGATWTELAKLEGPANDTEVQTASYDVASYMSDSTAIRFSAENLSSGTLFLDNIELSGGNGAQGSDPDADQTPPAYSNYPALVGADLLHNQGITGAGVSVAVVDTGLWPSRSLVEDTRGNPKFLVRYDAIRKELHLGDDLNGHGTHVSSLILNSSEVFGGGHNGIAPDAGIVGVKAFDNDGRGSYANIIHGLDWILQNKNVYGIRVVNMSFSAEPRSFYWDDPLNQAVMALWEAGLVIVASAGNHGPDPMTIGVPGNVPYVITVGAMSDASTPGVGSDDYLASFSSAGPTVEGFVKPEVVAPGGHMLGVVDPLALFPSQYPQWLEGHYFTMSGTSQAAAVVSGAVALMLDAAPWLTPDDVKCRLMSSARPAVVNGALAYSIFQQGAGNIHVFDAVNSSAIACANRGLNVSADLSGAQHFGGKANRDSEGNYYIEGLDGYMWSDIEGYMWSDLNGYMWSDGFLWNDGYMWSDGFLWNDISGYMWSDLAGYMWSDINGYMWSDLLTETMKINTWVDQQ